MSELKTFTTSRLIIRPLEMDDLADLYRLIYAEPEVRQYFTSITTYEAAEKKHLEKVEFNQRADNQGFGYWGVVRKQDNELIGQVLLGPPEPVDWIVLSASSPHYPLGAEVEIGYAFGQAYWRQGYATEACQPVIDYTFQTLKLARLVNSVLRVNQPSINLMKRLGFQSEDNLHPDGQDSLVGILLRK